MACIESYLRNCQRHARSPEFVIADDSTIAAPTRHAIQKIASKFPARVRYIGLAEKSRYAASLAAESHVPPGIVHFALFGDRRCTVSTGANRNCLLLDTAGRLVVSVDDDTICRIGAPSGREAEPSFFPGQDPTEFWFFADRTSAAESVEAIDMDVLACHEEILGTSVADSATGVRGRVAITLHGLAGDSGMASPRYYLTLGGASRERLVASPDAYRSAFSGREILRTVRRPAITQTPFCMTTFLGLDNRYLLPPFFPVQRNSDGILGQILSTLGNCTAFLPWTLLHAPEPRRRWEPRTLWFSATTLRLSDLVIAAIPAKQSQAEEMSPTVQLIDLGKHLEWIGQFSYLNFEDYLREMQEQRNFGYITALHGQLQYYGSSPSYWADDVTRMIEAISAAADAEDYMTPRDLCEPAGREEAGRLAQELIRKYGALLQAWPALFAAAARLSSEGIRMSVALSL